jgi:L-ribulokinase
LIVLDVDGKRAGGCDTLYDAASSMGHLKKQTFKPNPAAQKVYEKLQGEYETRHDYFGGGANDVMKRLKRIKAENRDV